MTKEFNNENESQSIEDLVGLEFDSLGFKEDDDGNVIAPEGSEENNSGSESDLEKGEQSKEEETSQDDKSEDRLLAGQFKSVEELEQAYTGILKNQYEKSQTAETKANEGSEQSSVIDTTELSREELTSVFEQDLADGTNYAVEYLKAKMEKRDLNKFEVEKLRQIDTENDSDIYADYVAKKTERNVMAKVDPLLSPIQEKEQQELYNKYVENEKAIVETYKTDFGEDLPELKRRLTPEGIDKILGRSEMAPVIMQQYQSGSKALAYKMLLSEAKKDFVVEKAASDQDKRKKSFPADVGTGSATPSKSKKAMTVEEAWEQALSEQQE